MAMVSNISFWLTVFTVFFSFCSAFV